MTERDLFQPINPPKELDGLTKDDLFLLRQAVIKHGVTTTEMEMPVARLLAREMGFGVTVSPRKEMRNIVVVGLTAGNPGSYPFHTGISSQKPSAFVVWDKRVSVRQIRDLITLAEEIGREMKASQGRGEPRYQVKDVFSNPHNCMLVPPGVSADELINSFDHPELVIAHSHDEAPGLVLVLKSEVPYFERRKVKVHEVLREEGIDLSDPDSLATLTLERVLQLRKKIKAAMGE